MAVTKIRSIIIVTLVGVVAGLSVGGLSLLRFYDKATKIDRSIAKVVVRDYIDRALVKRDDEAASLFVCRHPGDISIINKLRSDLASSEAQNGVSTQITISQSSEDSGGAVVDIELQINQGAATEVRTVIAYLRFHMANEDGWRVCSAEQLPSPAPSASVTPPTTS